MKLGVGIHHPNLRHSIIFASVANAADEENCQLYACKVVTTALQRHQMPVMCKYYSNEKRKLGDIVK